MVFFKLFILYTFLYTHNKFYNFELNSGSTELGNEEAGVSPFPWEAHKKKTLAESQDQQWPALSAEPVMSIDR